MDLRVDRLRRTGLPAGRHIPTAMRNDEYGLQAGFPTGRRARAVFVRGGRQFTVPCIILTVTNRYSIITFTNFRRRKMAHIVQGGIE